MDNICGIVLAAGRSSRMIFNKLTSPIAGHPMVWYSVDNLRRANIKRIIAVIGYQREQVKQAIGENVEWVIQEDQKGTGHAVSKALPIAKEENTLILFGDCPFLDSDIIMNTLKTHFEQDADVTLTTAILKDPRYLGHIWRDKENDIIKVSEDPGGTSDDNISTEIFSGLSIWKTHRLRRMIEQLPFKPKPNLIEEQDLPDAIELIAKNNGKIATCEVSEKNALGPNEPEEFIEATSYTTP